MYGCTDPYKFFVMSAVLAVVGVCLRRVAFVAPRPQGECFMFLSELLIVDAYRQAP